MTISIVNPKYFEKIEVTEDEGFTLVIENGREYRNIVNDICWQTSYDEGGFVVADGNEVLAFSKACSVLTDIFNMDANDRKILSKLQTDLVKEYAGADEYYSVIEKINAFGVTICNNSEYPLTFHDNVPLSDLIKFLGIRISEDEEGLIEKAVDYCVMIKKILKKKLIITVGFKDLMDEKECRQFQKMMKYNKIPMLMIERHTHPELDDPKKLRIIDKDLCVL